MHKSLASKVKEVEPVRFSSTALILSVVSSAAMLSCGASQSVDSVEEAVGAGRVQLRVVGGSVSQLKELVVTVSKVEADISGHWYKLVDQNQTIDLLKLTGDVYSILGSVQLPPGKLHQIRIRIDQDGVNYVVSKDGVKHPLNIPSDREKIEIYCEFTIPSCPEGSLIFDLDTGKSLFTVTNPRHCDRWGHWFDKEIVYTLRPVVKIKAQQLLSSCNTDGGVKPVVDASMSSPDLSDTSCQNVSCPAGQTCEHGSCVVTDPCINVSCPQGQTCIAGNCL